MTTVTTPVSFSFHETHDVRIQVIDGEPWFCLKDVCEVLTIANPRRVAAEILDSKGVRKTDTLTNGGQQQISFINEPNLYRVIFRSNKPEAKQFQDWVFNEVLPAIRKTGRYERPAAQSNELTAKDMLNLKHLIHIMTGQFRYKQAWSNGVWHCLRKVTGVKSPHPFSVSDLPEMADEIRRIMRITCAANRFIADMETEMIKRVIRRNEEVEPFLEEMRQEFLDVMRKEHAGLLALEKFESKCIENFRNRLN
ncbi:Bro-N domain-containing protein [Raoultella terrigena]|nr:Bro-N domain-containing protein [Escherichia coli]